jgi:hypothetical protein
MAEKDYSATPLTTKLGAKAGAEVVVFFTTSRAELARRFAKLKRTLAPADGLWIAYPKKSSPIETDLTFDAVQRIGLEAGLVDNKSIAFDDDWSAVRFVYRRDERKHAAVRAATAHEPGEDGRTGKAGAASSAHRKRRRGHR